MRSEPISVPTTSAQPVRAGHHIAMFMHGGVAPSGSTMDVPALTGLVQRLAEMFPITVFTVMQADGYREAFQCGNAHVKFVNAIEHDHPATIMFRTIQEFRKEQLLHRYSLVHGLWALPGGLAAVAAGKIAGIPSVVSLLGGESASLPEIGYGNMRRPGSRFGTLWTCRHASALTVLTQYQLDGLRRFKFDRRQNVEVIPLGAEPSFLQQAQRKPEAPPFNFLHIGHLNRVKDQQTLLRAFQVISKSIDCRLRIAGEDTLGGMLQQFAGELGIAKRVTFLGLCSQAELRDHLSWAHALLHSSLYEGEGVVFAEGASAGVLLCGTRVGLLADLGDSIGVVTEVGDYDGLARDVLRVLGNETLRASLVSRARTWAMEHTADWTASRFGELYERCLGSPYPATPAIDRHHATQVTVA